MIEIHREIIQIDPEYCRRNNFHNGTGGIKEKIYLQSRLHNVGMRSEIIFDVFNLSLFYQILQRI